MRFRLFRSKAFWFGVPGLVGLLWGWWVSMGNYSSAGFRGARYWVIGQMGGEVFAMWDAEGGPEWGEGVAEHKDMTVEVAKAEKGFWTTDNEWYPSYRIIYIPYYWPVMGYLAAWAGLMIWRKQKFEKRPVA